MARSSSSGAATSHWWRNLPSFPGSNCRPNTILHGPLIPQDEFPMPLGIAAIPRDKPLIYFAMGSSGTPEIVAKILESFEGRPYRVIAPVKFQLGQVPESPHSVECPRHRLGPGDPGQQDGRSRRHSRRHRNRDGRSTGGQAGCRRRHADGTGCQSGLSRTPRVRDTGSEIKEPVPACSGRNPEIAA